MYITKKMLLKSKGTNTILVNRLKTALIRRRLYMCKSTKYKLKMTYIFF